MLITFVLPMSAARQYLGKYAMRNVYDNMRNVNNISASN